VVPSYQRSLVNSRLTDLDHTLTSIVELSRTPGTSLNQAWVEDDAAPLADARVVVFHVLPGGVLLDVADSKLGNSHDMERTEPVVDEAPDELGQLARAFERMRLQLASLDRARREFIANASHELRTPLFSLGGFLELLASEDLDAETRAEFLNETREQVSRLQK